MNDRNVVNVASSKMTAPLIKLGPYLVQARGRINTFSMGQKYLYGVVVGHRIGENRGCGRPGIACIGGRIEANVGDRINLARH